MKRKDAISIVLVVLSSFASATEIPSRWNWVITSDFGPRLLSGKWDIHEGVDFSAGNNAFGSLIPAVEAGTVEQVAERGSFYNIIISGSQTGQQWLYGHIFRVGDLFVNNWELRFSAIHVNPTNPDNKILSNVIIQTDSSGNVIKILSAIPGQYIQAGSIAGNYLKGVNGFPIETRNSVAGGEYVAVMGDANTTPVPVHLHLGLNYPLDNPLFHLQHSPINVMDASFLSPSLSEEFDSESAKSITIKLKVNSRPGLDLNEVNFRVLEAGNPSSELSIASFNFGGVPGQAMAGAILQSDGETTGIVPGSGSIGDTLGSDTFIYRADLSGLSDGMYTLKASCIDVNGNENCSNTTTSFSIKKSSCSNDFQKPHVSIEPINNCVTSENVTITGHASDNCKLESVTVKGQTVTIGEKGGNFSITLNLSEGDNEIKAVATDEAGNTAETSIQVKVDTKAPNVVSKTPEGGPVALTAPVSITFDEDISEGQITIDGVSGTSTRSGRSLTFQHAKLQEDQTYTVRVTGVKDACGNAPKDGSAGLLADAA